MAVIAGMDTVKKLSNFTSDNNQTNGNELPPTEKEIADFFNSVNITSNDGSNSGGNQPPDPPARRTKASQYFWRRHYLSIIQEEDEANDRSAASSRAGSRPVSRPASTYDNIFRLSRISAVSSPLAVQEHFWILNKSLFCPHSTPHLPQKANECNILLT